VLQKQRNRGGTKDRMEVKEKKEKKRKERKGKETDNITCVVF
jgi:hypothetical protein